MSVIRRGAQEHSNLGEVCSDLGLLVRLRAEWREARRAVVWTNGCFDLFHAGHVLFLQAARSLGDVLVVGVNSDESVRRLKGEDRPFLEFASRVTVLKGMRSVDHVVAMREDTPCAEIGELRPDVCCKDDSYATMPLPERALVESYSGRMVLLPRIGGWSSTGIVERVRSGTGGDVR